MLLHGRLVNNAIDLCFITETWLRNNDEGRAWLDCSGVNNNWYKAITSSRVDGISGGIALLHKDNIKLTEIKTYQLHSYQYGKWSKDTTQPSHTHQNIQTAIHQHEHDNDGDFHNEFTEWIGENLANDKNLVITGDFNVHVNDQRDPDVQIFSAITSALGLNQHIKFSTHRAGNTLDLPFTKSNNNLNILQCKKGPTLTISNQTRSVKENDQLS